MAHFMKPGRQYRERIEQEAADRCLPQDDRGDRDPRQQREALLMVLVGKAAVHQGLQWFDFS
jgi:hypothetical protein